MRMREKIARALCRRNHAAISPNSEELRTYVEQNWNKWIYEADAVLDAMMTPDEAMARAAQTAVVARGEGDCITLDAMRDAWKAMLLAAKSPGAGGG